MKHFNVTGLCVPDKHYMASLSDKVNRIVADYIEKGAYFTINRARQFGKTTLLHQLEQAVRGRLLVISISFEAADDLFESKSAFVNGFLRKTSRMMRLGGVDEEVLAEWEPPVSGELPFEELDTRITRLAQAAGKGIVLLIDEVDKSSDNQIFLSFLGLLRHKYMLQSCDKDVTFQSVILAGIYDVKNLKLKLRPEEEQKYNSPWNIAADFDVDLSLSTEEIQGMLEEYSADTAIPMDILPVARRIHFYTSGYPFLVSWICKWVDEHGNGDWSVSNIDNAEKALLKNDNTLFDDIIKNVENQRELKKTVTRILLEGEGIPFVKTNPAINLGTMFGIFKENSGLVAVANIVFETFLYNHIIVGKMVEQSSFGYERNQFIANGQLDMELALRKFQEVMRAEYRKEDEAFIERQGRLLFLCFMKPIINGRGNYYVEPETRSNTRMDVVISYGGREYIVELKLWHGPQYREKGIRQLEEYLVNRNCESGYLISFNFNQDKEYVCCTLLLEKSGKRVYEVVV
ncbi:MAG: ATP-binding protein [Blautia sp.]|nr:ATP-binding protein [Blautia sp.]